MMSDLWRDRTLALAGLLQSALLANQLACTGHSDSDDFGALLASLFVFDPRRTEEIYNGVAGVRCGLQLMDQMLSEGLAAHAVPLRYARQLMLLEQRLAQQSTLFDELQYGLQQEASRDHSGTAAVAERCRNIDQIYQRTISTLDFRIRLRGDPEQLAQPTVVARIRVALLAGLRSALLWRQLDGHLVQLLFQRRLHREVRSWLSQLTVTVQ